MPYMKFLSVRPDVCHRLPSNFTSRWTPLLLAMRFPLLGLTQDFHPLDIAHAKRTRSASCSLAHTKPKSFFIFFEVFSWIKCHSFFLPAFFISSLPLLLQLHKLLPYRCLYLCKIQYLPVPIFGWYKNIAEMWQQTSCQQRFLRIQRCIRHNIIFYE